MTGVLLMLDTNALTAVLKARSPMLDRRLTHGPLCISVVTEDEIRFGLVHRAQKAGFPKLVHEALRRIDIRPWTSTTARQYVPLRAELAALGYPLAPLDLMIAADAMAEGATLITTDRAFAQVPDMLVEGYELEGQLSGVGVPRTSTQHDFTAGARRRAWRREGQPSD